MKLLIDECLSEELVHIARQRGHAEASHIRWLGREGWQDWNLMPLLIEGSWTLVTRNSRDFRGPEDNPGGAGLHAQQEIHAGLICLNAPGGMDLDLMVELFGIALDELNREPDLINRVLEVTKPSDSDGRIRITRYELPAL